MPHILLTEGRLLMLPLVAHALQVYGACSGLPGQSGSPVLDLADNKIIGVLSGYEVAESWASIWVPITAQHYAALERWKWQPGQDVWSVTASSPSPPPPPPFSASRHLCKFRTHA